MLESKSIKKYKVLNISPVTLIGESQADHQERVFSNEDPFFISRKLPLIDIGVFMLLR